MSGFKEILASRAKKEAPPSLDGVLAKTLKGTKRKDKYTAGWSGDYLRVSQLHGVCVREAVFQKLMPVDMEFDFCDFAGEFKMQLGTDAHSHLQNNVLGPMGLLRGRWRCRACLKIDIGFHPRECICGSVCIEFEEETYKNDEYMIKGHTDGMICKNRLMKVKSKELDLCLLEIKTTSKRIFDEVVTENKLPPYYAMQATVYQWLAGKDETMFLYFDRDSGRVASFMYTGEERFLDRALSQSRFILKDIKEKKVTGEFACASVKDTRAKTCPFKDVCFGLKEAPDGIVVTR